MSTNLTPDEFQQLRELIHKLSGLALTQDKQYLVQSRLEPLLRRHSMISYGELARRLQTLGDGRLRDEVVEAMTTHETSFNRDGHPFDEFRSCILPRLAETLRDRRQRSGLPFPRIRLWSVAASTGQEPYSLAMAIVDYVAEHPECGCSLDSFWILATDISEHALQIARTGNYTDWQIERGLTSAQRQRHFVRQGHHWQVSPTVRRLVEFRRVNVLQSLADIAGFDVVLCRNLLIYFDEPTRLSVCQKLVASLNPDGILMVGAAEQLPRGLESVMHQQSFGRTVAFVLGSANA